MQKFMEDFVHSVEKEFCRKKVHLNGYKSSRKDAQVSATKKKPAARPRSMTT